VKIVKNNIEMFLEYAVTSLVEVRKMLGI